MPAHNARKNFSQRASWTPFNNAKPSTKPGAMATVKDKNSAIQFTLTHL